MCSCDQSLVTVEFLWEKLSQPQFDNDLTRKTTFIEEWSWFKFKNLGLKLGTNLKLYSSVAKGLKLKVQRFWGLLPTFVEVTGEKVVGRLFCPPPPPPPPPSPSSSWIGLLLLKFIIADIISTQIADISNFFFFSGIYPASLKVAKAISINKKESKLECSNYRPISVLFNTGKTLGNLIHKGLSNFCIRINLLIHFTLDLNRIIQLLKQ